MQLAQNYPLALVARVVGCPRSTLYAPARPRSTPAALQTALREVVTQWPTYGYRRVTAELRRRGWRVGHNRIQRLLRTLGLTHIPPRRVVHTTDSDHPFPRYPNRVVNLCVVRPDQVWVGDITYIRLWTGFIYLAVLMDVFTRAIRGWHLGRYLDQTLTLTALRRALAQATPEIHHSDQGVQYAATAYVDLLTVHRIAISMAEVGEPTQNGYAERLMRTIKEEEVDLSEYHDYADAYRQIGRFLDQVYMHKRIHSALGYLTPVEFEQQWLRQQAEL
jgi:putative transposase